MTALFPELERGGPQPLPAVQGEDEPGGPFVRLELGPADQVLAASGWGIEKLHRLLDLPAGGPVRVRSARLRLGDGQMQVAIEGALDVVLLFRPRTPGPQDPSDFRVQLEGPVRNETVRRLMMHVENRLRAAPYRVVLKALRADPGRVIECLGPAPGSAPDSGSEPVDDDFDRSVVRTAYGTRAWRIFFAGLEHKRNFNYQLTGNVVMIRHEDLECGYATPCASDGTTSFINQPVTHRFRSRDPDGKRRLPVVDRITDITDDDVVRGGARKLEETLDLLAATEPLPELVLVKTACVPKVIGDDLSLAMRRFEAKTGVPVAFLDNLVQDDSDVFSSVLERLHRRPEPVDPAERARRINLVGFADGPDLDRLVGMLETLGVSINARLVPEVRLDDMRRYMAAELQVLMDTRHYSHVYERLLGTIDMPTLRLTAPFGVEGSRRWLGAVLDALGLDRGALDAAWDAEWEPLSAPWAELRSRARGRRLGFVVDPKNLGLLLDPSLGAGVPVLAMLAEMGFEPEFLVYADGASPPDALPGPATEFRNLEQLERALAGSPAQAFYSDYFFDRRLSRLGKAQFSLADFEPGPGGALRTLRHLLRITDTAFYRRYARYLGPAFGTPWATP